MQKEELNSYPWKNWNLPVKVKPPVVLKSLRLSYSLEESHARTSLYPAKPGMELLEGAIKANNSDSQKNMWRDAAAKSTNIHPSISFISADFSEKW